MRPPTLLQNTLAAWLSDQPLGLAATLTFLPRLPREPGCQTRWLGVREASECVRIYLRRLDRIAYGSANTRRGRRLAAAVVREGGARPAEKHIHYHLALEVPTGYSSEQWAEKARIEWTTMEWASPVHNVFKPMWSQQWITYVLKDRDKPIYLDAMDFESWHRV